MFSGRVIDLLKCGVVVFFWCHDSWPVVLCKPLALWLSAINYTVIWHRAPESPLGPLLHACSLIKVQGLVSADNPVRLALICWADDPGISSQSSDWFQRKAKQNTGQSVIVFSGLQQPYHTAAQDRLPTEAKQGWAWSVPGWETFSEN